MQRGHHCLLIVFLVFFHLLYAEKSDDPDISALTESSIFKNSPLKQEAPPLLGKKTDDRYKHLQMFSNALWAVEKSYYKTVPVEKLVESAINGMAKDLDPNSFFMSASALKNLKSETRGQFKGWGVKVKVENGIPVIVSVIKGSPADKKGLRSGDHLIAINNKSIMGSSIKAIEGMIDEHINKECQLSVKREGKGPVHQIILNARVISLKSVVFKRLMKDYLYIKIHSFTERTHREVRKIVRRESPFRGLILDLRGNPGGVFYSAVQVVDIFLSNGKIVQIKGRIPEYEQHYDARRAGTIKSDFPILVIIDEQTASAAEIVASALKENNRAIVVGKPSFGKGTVQSLIPITASHVMKLTVANYYTPGGNKIQDHGIIPDIRVMTTKEWYSRSGSDMVKQKVTVSDMQNIKTPSGKDDDMKKIFFEDVEKNKDIDLELKLSLQLLGHLDFKDKLSVF